MSIVGVVLDGLDTVMNNMNNANAQLAQKIDEAVQGAGIDCQGNAKKACPVDTGRLRNSILYHNAGLYTCVVDTNVVYAKFIEFGTRYQKAQPFLFPAYELAKKQLIADLKAL